MSIAGNAGVLNAIAKLEPISLDEINQQAQLMTRVDRKYFVPREIYAEMVMETASDLRVLEIDRQRRLRYLTVYFDSPDFEMFRHHVQGRRHRYKVRSRTYCDSGICQIEVKSKGYRGQTVKQRIPHDPASPTALDAASIDFLAPIIGSDPSRLIPVVETIYDRTTLSLGDQRITCDFDLRFEALGMTRFGPDDVLVESKSAGAPGRWDHLFRARGIRPHSASKYCVAAALHYPHLPSNPWRRTIRQYFA